MKFSAEDLEMLQEVVKEVPDILESLEQGILNLESSPDQEVVNTVFRAFHSLKGLAGFANVIPVVELSHSMEDLLKEVKNGTIAVKPELVDVLLESLDVLKLMFSKINEALLSMPEDSVEEMEIELENFGEKELIAQAKKFLGKEKNVEEESNIRSEQIESAQKESQLMISMEESLKDFVSELSENINEAESALLEYEANKNQENINSVMRAFHSIKGGARLLLSFAPPQTISETLLQIENQSHSLEALLHDAMEKKRNLSEEEIESVYRGLDLIKSLTEALLSEPSVKEESMSESEEHEEKLPKQEYLQTFEAFVNIADQFIEFIGYLIKGENQKPEHIRKLAEPLKVGLQKLEEANMISMIDSIVESALTLNLSELKKEREEFARWLDEKKKKVGLQASQNREVSLTSSGPTKKLMQFQTIKVSHEKLDKMMNLVGELLTLKNASFSLLRKVEESAPHLTHDVKNLAGNLGRLAYDFQSVVMSVRMVPIAELFNRYKRAVRDLSRSLKKKVNLIIEGEDTELDKSVIEMLVDPMTHIIRNAIDHGIEPPEERKKKGKSEEGMLFLRAYYKGSYAFIEIQDDGKGINPQEIRSRAVDRGLISAEEALKIPDSEIINYIFEPGFSTAKAVSDISGRGVGMDVVKTNIESIGGRVFVDSTVGKGTKIILRIPLSLLLIRGLMIRIGEERYIVPLEVVKETLKVPKEKIHKYSAGLLVDVRGETLPVIFAEEILSQTDVKLESKDFPFGLVPLLILEDSGIRYALVVDAFLDEGDYLVKSIPEYAKAGNIVSGATVMGDGSIVLIINPAFFVGW
ncbi:MAG: chemotaxis protein CheA [Thermotogaceae bacterium]|nr:chemotaxis protein CheA [Thermotogaceae bacterium]